MSDLAPGPNPYAPPGAPLEAPARPAVPGAGALRRAYFGHEFHVRSVGLLNVLGAVLLAVGAAVLSGVGTALPLTAYLAVVTLTILFAGLGLGLFRLEPWARWTAAALAGLALVVVLAGAAVVARGWVVGEPWLMLAAGWVVGVVLGFVLFLVVSKKGRVVFSPEYREVIAATPEVRYATGCVVHAVALALLLVPLFFVFAVVAFVRSRTGLSGP